MAEFDGFSKNEENALKIKSSFHLPVTEQNESTLLLNQSQSSEKSNDVSNEISKLLQESLQLDERKQELQILTRYLLQEHRRLTAERQSKERVYFTSDRSKESIAKELRIRLFVAYSSGKNNESVFEKFLDSLRRKCQNTYMMNVVDKAALHRKLTLLECMFSSFQEQLTTVETLMKSDYDILCQEHNEYFTTVMTECYKVEDSIYHITSLIIEE